MDFTWSVDGERLNIRIIHYDTGLNLPVKLHFTSQCFGTVIWIPEPMTLAGKLHIAMKNFSPREGIGHLPGQSRGNHPILGTLEQYNRRSQVFEMAYR